MRAKVQIICEMENYLRKKYNFAPVFQKNPSIRL